MGVFYEGHETFTRNNIQLVQEFLKLLKKSPIKSSVRRALRAYMRKPSPQSFNRIKARVRKFMKH